tara:strand:- start:360 stop:1340 length:981 start_codon:yes stop_codon:yes gene_type:complete
MNKEEKIFLAGHNGLVGNAIHDELLRKKFRHVIVRERKKLDLMNEKSVDKFFKLIRPQIVLICAAKVGGIQSNSNNPYEFLVINTTIQNNIFNACLKYKVRKVLYLGSSCIYPKFSKIPIKEEYILSDKLEKTNEAYALAKIAGLKAAESLILKHQMDIRCLMPCNLFGKKEKYFDINNIHVLPALIHKIYEAKIKKIQKVEIWGDGTPLREFMFTEDLAKNIIRIMQLSKKKYFQNIGDYYFYNIGSKSEISIKNLAKKISKIVGYRGNLYFNKSKPNGTLRKFMSKNKISKMLNIKVSPFDKSLKKTFTYYKEERRKLLSNKNI